MTGMIQRLLPLAVVLGALNPTVSNSGEIDSGMREIRQGQEKGDFEQIVDGLECIAYRFKDLLGLKNKTASKINAASDEIITAMQIYNQDPMVLENITDSIIADTDKIEAKRPPEPDVQNPIDEGVEKKLASLNPGDRREALNDLKRKIRTQKERLRAEVEKAKKAKIDATSLVSAAESASQRGLDIENVLKQTFESPAGGILTTASSKFGFIFLDMAIHVNPALSGRVSAAKHYLKRCDTAQGKFQDKLAQFDNFDQWVGYYQWELGMKFPSSEFEKSMALLDDLDRLQGKRTDQKSAEARRIGKLIDITTRETNATREKAESLVAYARFKDENIARIEAFSNLYNLGASIANLGAASSGPSSKGQAKASGTKGILDEFDRISEQKPTTIGPGTTNPPPVNRASPTTPPPVIPNGAMRMH